MTLSYVLSRSCACGIALAIQLSSFAEAQFDNVQIANDGPSDMHSKTLGDLNGDGFLDAVVAGTGGEIVWYQYPDWQRRTIVSSGGGWTTDLEVADIDGDGDADVVASDRFSNARVVWIENQGGGLSWAIRPVGGPDAHDIEVADLDRDGRLDIVTRLQGSTGDQIVVWRQQADGSWSQSTIGCPTGEGLDLADLDGDGDHDIVIGGYWYENDGSTNGGWAETRFALDWGHAATVVFAGDINGDGRADVAITPSESAGGNYRIGWYEAPADPRTVGWTSHTIEPQVETIVHGLALGDLDGDGDLDVATAEMHQGSNPDEVRVYYNDNAAGTSWTRQVLDGDGSHNIRVADIDADGDLDIFGTNWSGDSEVEYWENVSQSTGGGLSLDDWTYVQVDASRSTNDPDFGLGFGDVTNDGLPDIVSGPHVYHNPGGDMTGAWSRFDFPVDVDAALVVDVDGDTFADVIAQGLPTVYWLEADDQSGTSWTARGIASLPETSHVNSQGYGLAQIVSGGRPEIVLATGDGVHYLEIPANPESGNWPATRINSPGTEEGIAAGDVDRDGDIDIAGSISDGSGRMGVWFNPGDGSALWPSVEIGSLPDRYADRVAIEYVDDDQRLDVVVSAANGSPNGVYWFQAPADPVSGNWTRRLLAATDSANSMDTADFDGDGDVDVVVGEHMGDLETVIFENDGTGGGWAPHQVDAGRESHLGSRVHDLDGDGDLDIVSIGYTNSAFMHLWRNDAQTGGGTNTVSAPVFTPAPGSYNNPVDVVMTTATSGATIHYTVDGTIPDESSAAYSTPVAIDGDVQVRARAFRNGSTPSAVVTGSYSITVDDTPPGVASIVAVTATTLRVQFSETLDATSAVDTGNYAIDNGVSVLASALSTDGRLVTLTTTDLQENVAYTLTVSGIADTASPPNVSSAAAHGFDYEPLATGDGLIGFWNFNQSAGSVALDASGNANDGTINGPQSGAGPDGNALVFDGQNDYVDLGGLDAAPSALTLALWFRADAFNAGDARLISKAETRAEQSHYFMLSAIDGSSLRARLKLSGNTETLIGSAAIGTGTWTHVALTWDGSVLTLYQDGTAVASAAATGTIDQDPSVPVWIGANPTDTYAAWNGAIDEVYFYDRALSAGEVGQFVLVRGAGSAPSPPAGFRVTTNCSTAAPSASTTRCSSVARNRR